ncbi:ethanolaminephosphotransferase 1-like, partial [Chelonoidis abingdonii]|uniref:ethanolaminephosphotransferase 1-like n=1 Tax=Chelonoidis abingdonii TaxID=106734 RepID=UPI003F492913
LRIVPLWIAPNLLTFSGFLLILINYFLLPFYDWDYTASGANLGIVPTWVWLFGACTTFCAYALCSLDFKIARYGESTMSLGKTLIARYLVTAAVGVEVWHKPLLFGYYITDTLVILPIALVSISVLLGCFSSNKSNFGIEAGNLDLTSRVGVLSHVCCNVMQMCRVIISQMGYTTSEAFHWLLFPLALVVYTAVTGFLGKTEEMAFTIFTTLVNL